MPRSCVWSESVERAGRDPGRPPRPQSRSPSRAAACPRAGSCIIGAVVVFNIIALILVPPFPKEGAPGDACAFPVCYIEGTLEFPAPHVVWAPEGSTPPPASELITFYPSISSTILTMWIVMAVVLDRVDPDDARIEAHPRVAPRTCSNGSTSS